MACILQKGTSYILQSPNSSACIYQTMVRAFKWEPIYSLHPPDINVGILQIGVKLQSSDGNQFTTDTSHPSYTIFSTLQSASSGEEPSYNLHSFTACLYTSDRGQDTTRTMLQPPTYQSVHI